MNKILPVVIALEIGLILFLLTIIYTKNKQVLGAVSIIPISKSDLIFTEEKLKNFYEPKPNLVLTPYSINSDSLNETKTYSQEKPEGVFRIIALGDSVTFGQYVKPEDNYPKQLENLLKNACGNKTFEVINLGVPGYDIAYSVERFRIRGQKYNPDLVVWFLKQDDFTHINEFMIPLAERFKQEMEENGELKTLEENGQKYPYWGKAISEFTKTNGKEEIYRYQKRALETIGDYFKKDVLFVIPKDALTSEHKDMLSSVISTRTNTYRATVTNTFIDPTLSSSFDSHPNKKGYAVIANDILHSLKEQNLIPCG